MPFDYSGDGKADLAVYPPNASQFLLLQSMSGPAITPRPLGQGHLLV